MSGSIFFSAYLSRFFIYYQVPGVNAIIPVLNSSSCPWVSQTEGPECACVHIGGSLVIDYSKVIEISATIAACPGKVRARTNASVWRCTCRCTTVAHGDWVGGCSKGLVGAWLCRVVSGWVFSCSCGRRLCFFFRFKVNCSSPLYRPSLAHCGGTTPFLSLSFFLFSSLGIVFAVFLSPSPSLDVTTTVISTVNKQALLPPPQYGTCLHFYREGQRPNG